MYEESLQCFDQGLEIAESTNNKKLRMGIYLSVI
jgi:hypothetical protein